MSMEKVSPSEKCINAISPSKILQVSSNSINEFALQPLDMNLRKLLVQVTGQTDTVNISRVKIKVVARDAGLHRLAQYTPRLKVLILDGSCVDSLRDLGSSLKALETLSVVRCSLKSLDGVCGFRSLSTLIARDNSIKNPSPCSLIDKLTRLDLANNEIDDPSSFAFLQNCRHLRILDVAGNFFDNYRNTIIGLVPQIRILDGEDIEEIEMGLRVTEGDENCEILSDLTSEDEDLILFSEDEDDSSLLVMKSNEKMSSLNNMYKSKSTEDSRSHEMGAGDVEENNLIQKKECENTILKDNKNDEEERNLDPSSSSIYLITHEFHRLSILDFSASNIANNHHQSLETISSNKLSSGRAICGNLAASLRTRNSSKNPFTLSGAQASLY